MFTDEGTPDSAIGKALEAFRRYQAEQRAGRRTVSADHQVKQDDGEEEAGPSDDDDSTDDGGFHIGLSRRRQSESAHQVERRLTG